jgi:C1A family cysteine protease
MNIRCNEFLRNCVLVSLFFWGMGIVGCGGCSQPPGPTLPFGHGLGLIPVTREVYYAMPKAALPLKAEIPATYDISDKMPPVGDQGQQGSCVGWASGYDLKSYQENASHGWGATTPETQFSPAFIYNQRPTAGSGMLLPDALDILLSKGCCTLSLMPYNALDDSTQPSSAALQQALSFRIASWNAIRTDKAGNLDLDEIKAHLAAGEPVVFGMPVYENFETIGTEIYTQVSGNYLGGHALCLVGYDDSVQAFRVLNSWGTLWGDQGYFRISYSLFKTIAQEAYVTKDIVESPDTKFSLALNTDGQGQIQVNPYLNLYDPNTTVILTAVPEAGWKFDHWEGEVTATGSGLTVQVVMDKSKSVKAVFTQVNPDQYTLRISVKAGYGFIQITPATTNCAFFKGTTVTLVATGSFGVSRYPGAGLSNWTFDHWEGDVSDAQKVSSTLTLTMDSHKEIKVVFTPTLSSPNKNVDLFTEIQGAGQVLRNPNAQSFSQPVVVGLTAVPSPDWNFDHWEGTLAGNSAKAAVTITPEMFGGTVARDIYVLAVFARASPSPPPDPTKYDKLIPGFYTGFIQESFQSNLRGNGQSSYPINLTVPESGVIDLATLINGVVVNNTSFDPNTKTQLFDYSQTSTPGDGETIEVTGQITFQQRNVNTMKFNDQYVIKEFFMNYVIDTITVTASGTLIRQ